MLAACSLSCSASQEIASCSTGMPSRTNIAMIAAKIPNTRIVASAVASETVLCHWRLGCAFIRPLSHEPMELARGRDVLPAWGRRLSALVDWERRTHTKPLLQPVRQCSSKENTYPCSDGTRVENTFH